MAILADQPFKGLFVLSAIGLELLRLPLYLIKFSMRYGRQHPEWTFRQAIGVHIVRKILHYVAKTQGVTNLSLKPGAEKERFVVIKPADSAQYVGPLRINQDITPENIGGTWYPAPFSQSRQRSNVKVILHIHGGAFVVADGRTQASGYFAKKLLNHTPATHMFFPQYRLSELPASKTSNPFPAAFQDTLTAYLYLLNDLKISPEDIVFSGDSAGGNLAIALLRYVEEFGADLGIPRPSATLLWSPWINPSDTSASYVYDNNNYATDYLSPPFTYWGEAAYAGLAGLSLLSHPYITFKDRPFKTSVPIYVNTGGAELLCFDDIEFAEDMKKAGNDAEVYVERLVPHDTVSMGHIMGFDREATNSARRAGEWLSGKRA